jgi:hypothetical protein
MTTINVFCVHLHQFKHTPLALGYIAAMLRHYKPELAEKMTISWIRDANRVKDDAWMTTIPGQSIFLMSDYPWNIRTHLALSQRLKEIDPSHVIVHGGPYVPYKDSSFLEKYPYIDFLVHREGEITGMELMEQLLTTREYSSVKGISYREGSTIRMTGPRAPITDMTTIPSPFITGVFDDLLPEIDLAVLETNRGCPFKCAFCSWNMDLSTVVKQDLGRVFEELEWVGKHKITSLFIADANFGILERDIAVAEQICRVNARYGFPKNAILVHGNNTRRSIEISQLLIESKISTNLVLAIQTLDPTALKNIHRKPISMDYFKQVKEEYIKRHLPVAAQFMIGLPGSTYGSFKKDIDYIIHEKMYPMIFATMVLPNSKMDEPEYRKEYGIETEILASDDGNWELVVQTCSFTREEYRGILILCMFASLGFCYRALKYVVYFAAVESAIPPSDILERVLLAGEKEAKQKNGPERYPVLSGIFRILADGAADYLEKKIYQDIRDYSRAAYLDIENRNLWDAFYMEVSDILIESVGVDPQLLETALRVQRRILPSRYNDRTSVRLDYDFCSFYSQDSNGNGRRSLKTFTGPVTFEVADPKGVCSNIELVYKTMRDLPNYFELNSPLWRIS